MHNQTKTVGRWSVLGGLVGFFFLHPVAMLIITRPAPGNIHGLAQGILVILQETLRAHHVGMSLYFTLFGAAFGFLTGLLYAGIQLQKEELHRHKIVVEGMLIERDAILNSAGEGIIGLDGNGRHTFMNKAASEMLGFVPEEVMRKTGHTMWHHTKANGLPFPESECPILSSWKEGGSHRVSDEVFWRKDRTSFPVEYCATPIRESGVLAGAVVTFRDVTEQRLAEAEKKRLDQQLKEAREHEIDIGLQIQESLLAGKPPRGIRGCSIGAVTIPSLGIDGDFIDFYSHTPFIFDVLAGDVMGKGIPAALVGAAAKSHFIRAIARLITLSPENRLPRLGDIIQRMHAEMTPQLCSLEKFICLTFARFDLTAKEVTLVNAGHCDPIRFFGGSGEVHVLQGTGNMPLGINPQEVYLEFVAPIEAGDIFVFYSDGVTEARGSAREFFGKERLISSIAENRNRPPAAIVRQVIDDLKNFSGQETQSDDLTLVIVGID